MVLALTSSCSNGDDKPAPSQGTSIDVSGDARLDGKAFDSQFVGAVVLADGLVTPCQGALPAIEGGHYDIPVLTEEGGTGCGRPGAKVVLWTYAGDRIIYSTNSFAWPSGKKATFDPEYSTTEPQGAAPDVAQFSGEVYGDDGQPVPVGTDVEAFVGDARCGVASVRRSDSFLGYVISVVGPDSIPGCTQDVAITFHVDGKPADSNPVLNRPPGVREPIDLRL